MLSRYVVIPNKLLNTLQYKQDRQSPQLSLLPHTAICMLWGGNQTRSSPLIMREPQAAPGPQLAKVVVTIPKPHDTLVQTEQALRSVPRNETELNISFSHLRVGLSAQTPPKSWTYPLKENRRTAVRHENQRISKARMEREQPLFGKAGSS